jgi:hypothetical protein
MRRLTGTLLLIALVLVFPVACKKKRKRAPVVFDDGMLASMVQTADPRASVQLVRGFYSVEGNAWRWTSRNFTVSLRPPKTAAQTGARLVLKLAVPEVSIQRLKSVKLSATVNGYALPPEEYAKPGDYTYSCDVPPSALTGNAVTVDFTLDKALPPTASDQRELGVVVSMIGFEAK